MSLCRGLVRNVKNQVGLVIKFLRVRCVQLSVNDELCGGRTRPGLSVARSVDEGKRMHRAF